MSDQSQSPTQEAISTVSIAAILVALCLYAGATDGLPIVTPFMEWTVGQLEPVTPVFAKGYPLLVACAYIGAFVFIIGLAFAPSIANWFSQSQLWAIERQTYKLKRNRDRIIRARRAKDDFDVV
jgi:hypothetical protein